MKGDKEIVGTLTGFDDYVSILYFAFLFCYVVSNLAIAPP